MAKKQSKRADKIRKERNRLAAQNDPHLLLLEAQRFLERGDQEHALSLAVEVEKLFQQPEEILRVRQFQGEALLQKALRLPPVEQLKHLEQALDLDPKSIKIRFQLGVCLFRLDDTASAQAHFQHLLKQTPETIASAELPSTLPTLASIVNLTIKKQEPSDVFQSLLQLSLDQTTRDIVETLARIQEAAPSTVETMRTLETLTRRLKSKKTLYPSLEYYQGIAAIQAGDLDMAHRSLQKARLAGFHQPWLFHNLAALIQNDLHQLYQKGQWQKILETLKETGLQQDMTFSPLKYQCYFQLGLAAVQKEDWKMGIRQFRKALQEKKTPEIWQNLALVEERLDHWQAAGEAWQQMAQDKESAWPIETQIFLWRHAAECFEKAPDIESVEAEEKCRKQLRTLGKKQPGGLGQEDVFAMVEMFQQKGDWKAAEAELKRYLKQSPDNVEALTRMGALVLEKSPEKSIPFWKRVMALTTSEQPAHREAKSMLLKIYLDMLGSTGKRYTAKDFLKTVESALEDLPGHPKLLATLAKAQWANQKEQASLETLEIVYAGHYNNKANAQQMEVMADVLLGATRLNKIGETFLNRIMPEFRPHADIDFWLQMGGIILKNSGTDPKWASYFWDEAFERVREGAEPAYSIASLLVEIHDLIEMQQDRSQLHSRLLGSRKKVDVPPSSVLTEIQQAYRQRMLNEETLPAHAALVQYLAAFDAFHEQKDKKSALQHLKDARKLAAQSGDMPLAKTIDEIMDTLKISDFSGSRSEFQAFLEAMFS